MLIPVVYHKERKTSIIHVNIKIIYFISNVLSKPYKWEKEFVYLLRNKISMCAFISHKNVHMIITTINFKKIGSIIFK